MKIDESVFVAWNAHVAGDVEIGADSSVWYSTTVRGDSAEICIGERTNIQDGAVVHVDTDVPCLIGNDVTVGHGAILHGCTVEDGCTVGMGAIVLNGVRIGKDSMVGSGALVTQRKEFPPRSVIMGVPAKSVRTLNDDEVSDMRKNAAHYVELAKKAKVDDENKRISAVAHRD